MIDTGRVLLEWGKWTPNGSGWRWGRRRVGRNSAGPSQPALAASIAAMVRPRATV